MIFVEPLVPQQHRPGIGECDLPSLPARKGVLLTWGQSFSEGTDSVCERQLSRVDNGLVPAEQVIKRLGAILERLAYGMMPRDVK